MNKTIDQSGRQAPEPQETLPEQLEQRTDAWRASLPAHISVERFKRVIINAINQNPNLMYADRRSLWTACSQAANDGLQPDGKEGALVVYKTKTKVRGANGQEVEKWIEKVQWMPMIYGLRLKVRRSGEIAKWECQVVREKDVFKYVLGDTPHIVHEPYLGPGPAGGVKYAYSIATTKDGEVSREVMTIDEINRVRAVSKAPNSPAWTLWFEEMARKVVARRHSKSLPMNTDVDELLAREDANGEDGKNEAPPPRPSLAQFTQERMPDPAPEPAEESPADEKKLGAKDANPEDEKAPAPEPTFAGHNEAFELGIKNRKDGKPKVPPSSLEPVYHDAFEAGWTKEDDSRKPKAGQGRRA